MQAGRRNPFEAFSTADTSDAGDLIAYLDLVTSIAAGDKARTYAAQFLGEGMRVLDVGCGTGDDVRAITQLVGSTGSVAGVDTSAAMIEAAIARGVPSNAQFLLGTADALPFGDASFDAVRAERVFQHLREPEAAARELRRVLRAQGTALLFDQDWATVMLAGADAMMTQKILAAFLTRIANPLAGRNARGLLRRAGFTSVELHAMVAAVPLPVAFELVLESAVDAALQDRVIDTGAAKEWLHALLIADRTGEFFFGVTVVLALAR